MQIIIDHTLKENYSQENKIIFTEAVLLNFVFMVYITTPMSKQKKQTKSGTGLQGQINLQNSFAPFNPPRITVTCLARNVVDSIKTQVGLGPNPQ